MDEQPTTPDGAPYVPEQPPIFPVQQAAPVAQPAPIAQAAPVTQPAPIAQTMPQAPVSTAPQYPTGSAYAWSAAPAASAFTQPSAPAPVATSAPRAKRHWPAVVTASVLAARSKHPRFADAQGDGVAVVAQGLFLLWLDAKHARTFQRLNPSHTFGQVGRSVE